MFEDGISFWQILLLLNAIFGLLFFEWGWSKMHRFRFPNKDLNDINPAFRRDDAPKWQKWKFYPGAMTLLIPRFLIFIGTPTLCYFPVKLVLIGHKQGEPTSGFAGKACTILAGFTGYVCNLMLGAVVRRKYPTLDDVNHYQEYLGTKDEQKKFQQEKEDHAIVPKRGPGPASVVVSNHTGWVEGFGMLPKFCPSFSSRAESLGVPVFRTLLNALQTLYMPRGGTQADRD